LRLAEARQAALLAAEIRLDLARLALFEGQPGEAERLAGEVAREYAERGLPSDQARAEALLAGALLAGGRPGAASETAARARALAQASDNPDLQIFVATAVAPAGAPAAALGQLRWAVAESDRLGFVTAGLEARLTLGALQLRSGNPAAGRATLEQVRRLAEKNGHKRLARQATALAGESPPLRLG
jgi:hypothetical protein